MPTQRLLYTNQNGESIELSPLSVYSTNVSEDVTGLSDVSAKVNTVQAIGQDGVTWASTIIQQRDITIKGRINERDVARKGIYRRGLNHVLNPKYKGRLEFIHGDFRRQIACFPEKAPMYSGDRYYDLYTIDLVCPSPFWEEVTSSSVSVSSWESGWEFPFEIDDAGFIFGNKSLGVTVYVTNSGDTECGMSVKFTALGPVTNPELLNIRTGEFLRVNTSMIAGDQIIINTHYGNKTAHLIRDKQACPIFRYIDADSTFFMLDLGTNAFQAGAEFGAGDLDITITYSNQYLGV